MQQLLVVAFLAVAGAAPALAASPTLPVGPQFQVNRYTTSTQQAPAVTPDGSGGFVVVWQSAGSGGTDSSGSSVQAQRFTYRGIPVGTEFQVNTYTTAYQFSPVVGSDGGNGFVVVWVAEEGGGGTDTDGWSIQAQRFASTGAPVGPEFQVNTYTTGHQQFPDVGPDGSGGFVIAWQSEGSSETDTHGDSVQGQRFASTGMPAGPQFQVNTYTTSDQRDPAVAPDGSGGFVVAWTSGGSSGTDADGSSVQAQRFAPTGAPVGPEFQVNSHTTGAQIAPAVAPDGAGGFVVVWGHNARPEASTTSIRGHHFASTGSPVGSEFLVTTDDGGQVRNPAVGLNGSGGFVVVWESSSPTDPPDPSSANVQGRAFASTGEPLGSQFQVNTYTTSEQREPRVGPDGSGGFVVVWMSDGSIGTDTDLHSVQGQRFEEIPVLAGDGRGRLERDCYIGLGGYSEADLVPLNKKGTKRGIRCTDCDPACDNDVGVVDYPNGLCIFMVSACVNNTAVAGCDPATRTPKKVRARAKSSRAAGGPENFSFDSTLPDDLTAACSEPRGFAVPVRGKRDDKPGKGTVLLRATKPADRDKFVFICDPRPSGEACPTTTTSSTTTTTLTPTCFVDTGLTVTDPCNQLEWEKKDAADGTPDIENLHDVDNSYPWACWCPTFGSQGLGQPNAEAAATCAAQTGGDFFCTPCECDPIYTWNLTTIWDWVNQVNAEGYGGHTDWRLPTVATCDGSLTGVAAELETCLLAPYPCPRAPCVDPILGPTTIVVPYWSASARYGNRCAVNFEHGWVPSLFPATPLAVRAVRRGQ